MRILSFLVCFFLMLSTAFAKDFKVATVDLAKLFSEYPGTKDAQDKFNAIALQKKQKDIAGEEQDLQDHGYRTEENRPRFRLPSEKPTKNIYAEKNWKIKTQTEKPDFGRAENR